MDMIHDTSMYLLPFQQIKILKIPNYSFSIYGRFQPIIPIVHFWAFLKISQIEKWPEPKKSLYQKINFFMHVNHPKEFLKSVYSEALFSQLFAPAFAPLCKEPGILTPKLFDLMSLFGQDLPKNHLAEQICDNCAASNICLLYTSPSPRD